MMLSDEEICSRYLAGETQSAISLIDGRGQGNIRYVLKKNKISLRDRYKERRKYGPYTEETVKFIIESYATGKNQHEIARVLGKFQGEIRRILIENKISLRNAREEQLKGAYIAGEKAKKSGQVQAMSKVWNSSPEGKRHLQEMGGTWNSSPEGIKYHLLSFRELWADPDFIRASNERLDKFNNTPSVKKAASLRFTKLHTDHPETHIQNGRGHKTLVEGHWFPSMAQADVWIKLKSLGADPMHEEEVCEVLLRKDGVPCVSTPVGNFYPDTMLRHSVLDIPENVPIEIKDRDGKWEWSKQQVWAVENGEAVLLCREDISKAAVDDWNLKKSERNKK